MTTSVVEDRLAAAAEATTGFLCSPQQRRLWRIQQSSGARAFVCSGRVLVEGALDAERLREALKRLLARHEILRTTYQRPPELELPLMVTAETELVFEQRDLCSFVGERQAAEIDREAQRLTARPFDLARGALVRVALLTLSPERHIFLIGLPALSMDAPGLRALIEALFSTYAEPAARVEDEIPYSNIALWLDEFLEDEESEVAREHWRARGPAVRMGRKLPFERYRRATSDFAPEAISWNLEPLGLAELEQRASELEVSLQALLLAAWWTVLWKRTSQADLVLGVVYDGRDFEELEAAPGLLARFLPLHLTLDGHTTFAELAQRIEELSQEAEDSQGCFTWDDLVAEPDAASPRFFPLCFEYQSLGELETSGDLRISILDLDACIDRFLVKLKFIESREGCRAELRYDPAAIIAEEADSLAEQTRTLLEHVGSLERLEDAVLSSAAERRYLLTELNETAGAAPDGRSMHEQISEWARRAPERIAVVFEDYCLTYGELDTRSEKLAQTLITSGLGPEERVALVLDRSLEMIIALQAVLKAGGAYVPLDPEVPQHRLASLLEALGSPLILTEERLLERLPSGCSAIFLIDRWQIDRSDFMPALPRARRENLAYVLFTSGSTGEPKRVGVEHRQLSNYVAGIVERLGITDGASYAMVSTFAADLGNTVLFPALSRGGCLHVVSRQRAADPERLGRYFDRCRIDVLKIVPSHLSAVLAPSGSAALPRRALILGGEAVSWELVQRVAAAAPGCRIFNHYGPTETTVGVLAGTIGRPKDQRPSPSLGQPLSGSRIYLTGPRLNPVALGVPGELVVGGDAPARGYLGQPRSTASRFVPDPFAESAGSRLYRTGDLVVHLAEGGLRFLGRIDRQIKLRGYRIELGEIEVVARRHPSVREAVVTVAKGAGASAMLVAYVLPASGGFEVGDLKSALARSLPDYMVPSAFVVLDELPLTANGKIDFSALPSPDSEGPREASAAAPKTPIEDVVAGIWCELLERESVGVGDSFFELGGHSLLAMQLLSRLREAFGVEMSLPELFDEPTVAASSRVISAALGAEARVESPPIEPVARDGELPLSFAQERLWFVHQLAPESPLYNIPTNVALSQELVPHALQWALNETVRRHEVLRTSFPELGGKPRQVIAEAGAQLLPIIDLSRLAKDRQSLESGRLASEEAKRSFDLARGPLFRTMLLRFEQGYHLLMTMHHIISDAWSMTLVVQELPALYRAGLEGRVSPLAELPVQYADFAHWQRQWLRGETLQELLRFWRVQLADAPPDLRLPLDRPRPAVRTSWGRSVPVRFSLEQSTALRKLSHAAGATVFMTLLAAFKAVLRYRSGQSDIVVGTNAANRNQFQSEKLIGFFINQLVLRTDLSGDWSFRELLERVRAVALSAYAHQDLPFEKLVEELRPDRDPSRPLLFQVKAELQSRPSQAPELRDLEITPIPIGRPPVRYDLHLSLVDDGEGISGVLYFDDQLFETATVEGLAEQLVSVLSRVTEHPDTRFSELAESFDREEGQTQARLLKAKLKRVRRKAVQV
ncbi:MAG: amino acid adenylation domain-containing protein [Acidobacteriota bacterium]